MVLFNMWHACIKLTGPLLAPLELVSTSNLQRRHTNSPGKPVGLVNAQESKSVGVALTPVHFIKGALYTRLNKLV